MEFAKILSLYDAYVDTYRKPDGALPEMMELKRVHTGCVVDNARLIAAAEKFSPDLAEAAAIAALLHDTGRYEQLKLYNTFRDSESVDHAVFSHDIVKSHGWVEDEGILSAILFHNRYALPENLDERTKLLSHIVRDADKLDIFRVLEDKLSNTDWRSDSRTFWNLAIDAPPNPVVVESIAAGRGVDYQNVKSLADFVLIQIGWMVSGLYFPHARRLCRERGHLAFRRKFLLELVPASSRDAVSSLCDLAENMI